MNEYAVGFKLLLSYDVDGKKLQEYHQFVMGRYIPLMQSMGLEMSEAWHTVYGNAPNNMLGFVCDNRQTMVDLLNNEAWLELNVQLEKYVIDFTYKVVPFRNRFQI